MTRKERTGWRGENYSRLHRLFDPQFYMMDIDSVEFIVVGGEPRPRALLELKSRALTEADLNNVQSKLLAELASGYRGGIDAYLVGYDEHAFDYFDVRAINDIARNRLMRAGHDNGAVLMSLRRYIRFIGALHKIRLKDDKLDQAVEDVVERLAELKRIDQKPRVE